MAPFEYTALLWGILIDWTVWNVLPATRVYAGGGIVIAECAAVSPASYLFRGSK